MIFTTTGAAPPQTGERKLLSTGWRSMSVEPLAIQGAGFSPIDNNRHVMLFGPRFACRCRHNQKVSPFFHLLVGISRENYRILDSSLSDSGRAFVAGGGLDLHLTDPLALRVIQLDYLRTRVGDRYLNSGRLSFGIVWRSGRK